MIKLDATANIIGKVHLLQLHWFLLLVNNLLCEESVCEVCKCFDILENLQKSL